jgi:type IX secretion system PorP/SprF family membrane protein
MKKIKVFTIAAVCLLLGGFVKAQQDAQYSMYMFNQLALNPAYSGVFDQAQAQMIFRRQWLDLPGAPQTAGFNVHGPMRNENVALGLSFVNDRHGIINSNNLMTSYAYHLSFPKSRLSLGLQAGLENFSANLNTVSLSPQQEFDQAFAANISQWSFNYGAGAFWYSDRFFVGFSVPHIRNNIISDQDLNNVFVARRRTHAFLTGGYVIDLGATTKLKPSMLMKYASGAPMQIDLNMQVYFYENIGLGISYRTMDAITLMGEIQLSKNFRLGYAFDQTVNKLGRYTGGTHEVMLRYNWGFSKDKNLTPRYF